MKNVVIISTLILILVIVGCGGSNISLAPIYRCETEDCILLNKNSQIRANELRNNPDLVDLESPSYNFEKVTDAIQSVDCSKFCKDEGYNIYSTDMETMLNRLTGKKNYVVTCLCADERKENTDK